MIRNKVGLRTPPCITPAPSYISWYLVFIFVYLYSHSIVLIRFSSILYFLILLNSMSWFTVSNADFKSMNRLHNLFCFLFLNFIRIYSVILSIFISHPMPFLNPVCPSFSFHLLLFFNSFHSFSFSIVSSSLYIGDVFVIGLAFMNVFQSDLSLGMYIYCRRFCPYYSVVFSCRQWFR